MKNELKMPVEIRALCMAPGTDLSGWSCGRCRHHNATETRKCQRCYGSRDYYAMLPALRTPTSASMQTDPQGDKLGETVVHTEGISSIAAGAGTLSSSSLPKRLCPASALEPACGIELPLTNEQAKKRMLPSKRNVLHEQIQ